MNVENSRGRKSKANAAVRGLPAKGASREAYLTKLQNWTKYLNGLDGGIPGGELRELGGKNAPWPLKGRGTDPRMSGGLL